jgi:hypothetical protein
MTAVELIAQAIRGTSECPVFPAKTERGVCCVTGQETECVPRKELIGAAFTNLDLLACPASDLVGLDAYVTMKYKWARMSSWIASEDFGFKRLDRQGVRNTVIGWEPTEKRWAAYATTSYKKHGALHAPVNSGSQCIWRFENVTVDCSNREKLNDWWGVMLEAMKRGISRPSLEEMSIYAPTLKKVGLTYWEELRSWGKDKYLSPLYKFLCYLLPSQAEIKEGFFDL